MKIAIVGPGRCGKDTVADWLRDNTTLRYAFATSRVIAPYAAATLGLTVDEAFERRHESRDLWFDLAVKLRGEDPAFLAREALRHGDICVGIRDRLEIETTVAERLVDLVVWVDRPGIPDDPTLKYGPEFADVVIPNWWGVEDLYDRVERLAWTWGVLN